MRRAVSTVFICIALAAVAGPEAAAGAAGGGPAGPSGAGGGSAPPAAAGREVVVDRAFVPSEKRPQGEVRLVRRDGHAVVQTILYTRVLKRVLANISGKERRNWPAGQAGHEEMERYVAALEEYRVKEGGTAGDESSTGADAGTAASGRRKTMLIEFVEAGDRSFVAIGGVELEGSGGDVRIRKRGTPAVLALSSVYVGRNMRLIVADAFGLSPEEAGRRVARAAIP
jgi:hypothetical protein